MRALSCVMAIVGIAATATAWAAPTVAEVGDVDSFGRTVKYLGAKSSPTISFTTDCSSVPSPAETRCVQVPADVYDEANLLSIKLPAFASRSVVCFSLVSQMYYHLSNTDASKQTGQFSLLHEVTLASSVLNNLSLLDPSTGLPFNGRITFTMVAYLDQHALAAGDFGGKRLTVSRECIGGLISKQVLREVYGLSAAQATAFFSNPITVTIGARGQLNRVNNGFVSVGLRLFGD